MKVEIVPKTKSGRDAELAETLGRFAETARKAKDFYVRNSFNTGIFAHYVKEVELKHGEFGPWLAAYQPELSRLDAATKRPKSASVLSEDMAFVKNIIEDSGLKLKEVCKTLENCYGGKFPEGGNLGQLLIGEAEVPQSVRAIQSKITALVGDKSKRQLLARFAQMDDEGNPQRGRRPGEGGKRALTAAEKAVKTAEQANQITKEIQAAVVDLGPAFTALPDDDLEAHLHYLDLHVKAVKTWLRTPPHQRDVKDVARLLVF